MSEARHGSRALRLAALAFVLAIGASGCADLHFTRGPFLRLEPSALAPGETRTRDVLSALGPPDKLSRVGAGFAFLYERFDARERQLSISVPRVDGLKLVLGRGTARRQTLLLEFDADGTLLARRIEDRSGRIGSGGALQLVVVVAPLVDVSPLTDRAPQHRWGAGTPPPALPGAQPRTGPGQRRGRPRAAGHAEARGPAHPRGAQARGSPLGATTRPARAARPQRVRAFHSS